MCSRSDFYQARDARSLEYGVERSIFDTPVGVVVGPDVASTPGGQFLVLSLVNMLARLHRSLVLGIPDHALVVEMPNVSGYTLSDAVESLVRAIDPFLDLQLKMPGQEIVSLGVGGKCSSGLPCYVSGSHWCASVHHQPAYLKAFDSPTPGLAMSACIGAASLLRQLLGDNIRSARLSIWNFAEGEDAAEGPVADHSVNVGDVMMVGAGGVGCCLAYWMACFGTAGKWIVVDGDRIELSNTNRCLGFLVSHTDWGGASAKYKADVVAKLVGGYAANCWYDKFPQDSFTPDLVLPLANEGGVRHAIGARGEPLLLHSTTGRSWNSQLHRHIPERDQCISCRFRSVEERAMFKCAETAIEQPTGTSTDAALPFLSASAGLMLYAGLKQLANGTLADSSRNKWNLDFRSNHKWFQATTASCVAGCVSCPPRSVRRSAGAKTRWRHIDAAQSSSKVSLAD